LCIYIYIFHFKNEKKKKQKKKTQQHKEAIVFQNRIYSHGTATNEIKLKYILVEEEEKESRKKENIS
jgi:ABC-type polar amino acid transport system ATPase subunit